MNDAMTFLATFMNLPLVAMVLARIGGFVAFVPFFSSGVIPIKARVLFALTVTLLVVPFVGPTVTIPNRLGLLAPAVMSELMIGLVFGFALVTVFAGLQLGGRMIGQQMGLALARVFDPLLNEDNSVLSQLYFWLAMIIFLAIGGHHALLGAIIKSFATVPAGTFMITPEVLAVLCDVIQTAFVLALKVSAPVIVTIFLATLALGFVARTVPQLNILSIGFPLRVLMGFVLTIVCLAAAIDIFMTTFNDVCLWMYDLLHV